MKLWDEFKTFAFKGNMVDLAVAVVIGGAFGAVVSSMVKHIIMPILSYVVPHEEGYVGWHIGRVQIGHFVGELVTFLAIAIAVFIIVVKFFGTIEKVALRQKAAAPTTKDCPLCCSKIPVAAKKCAFCTSDVPA